MLENKKAKRLLGYTRHHILGALCTACLAGSFVSVVDVHDAHAQDSSDEARAQKAYKDAERAFKTGDYSESIRRFNVLRSKFPYSGLAVLADLRIADAYFEQEKYATAVEQYRAFSKLHPDDDRVTYANWRVAFAFYKQMPREWFFLPPGYERDLDRAKEAERELQYFLRRNPETEYTAEATRKLKETRRRLADHELYVAKFYLKRDNPRAAAMRLSYLLQNYPGLGLDPQALFLLARAYLELDDVNKAVVALTDLIEYYPKHPLALDAKDYMAKHKLTPQAKSEDAKK